MIHALRSILSLLVAMLLVAVLSSCGPISLQPDLTAPPATPTPYLPTALPATPTLPPPRITVRTSQTKLKVHDTVTVTAEVNVGAASDIGNPLYYVEFDDVGAMPAERPEHDLQFGGMTFVVGESTILNLVSIDNHSGPVIVQGSGFQAVFQAMRPGSTELTLALNGEVCVWTDLSTRVETYNVPGCTWDYENWSSSVVVTVEPMDQ